MKSKKYLLILIAILLILPSLVLAEGGLVPCGGTGQQACTLCDLIGLGQSLLNLFIKVILFYVALFMLLYAGFLIITDKNKKQGYDIIKKVLIGIVVVLLAWTIVNTIIYVLAPDTKDNNGRTLMKSWNKIECGSGSIPQGDQIDKTKTEDEPVRVEN